MRRWFFLCLFSALILGSFPVRARVLMDGYIDYRTSGSRMYLFIEEMTNFSDTVTDRLRLRVWASEHRWRPDRKGRLIAFSLLPRLYPLEDRNDLDFSRPLHRPPTGWYYVTITLEERTFDENGKAKWILHDVVEFDDQQYFRRGGDVWPPFPFD